MALNAGNSSMRTSKRKICSTVIETSRSAAIRMTGKTSIAVVLISAYSLMLPIGFTLLMTGKASEYCSNWKDWCGNRCTDSILLDVLRYKSGNNVHHDQRLMEPRHFEYGRFTIRWKLSRLMRRIVGLIIFLGMAGVTSIGSIIIISVMTGKAIGCNCRMRSNQCIVIIMVRECGGFPVRIVV